jgi:hypothetical protein
MRKVTTSTEAKLAKHKEGCRVAVVQPGLKVRLAKSLLQTWAKLLVACSTQVIYVALYATLES